MAKSSNKDFQRTLSVDIEAFQSRFRYPDLPGLPNYTGGLVGYFGYDTVRYVEKKLRYTEPPDNIGCPDILLMVSNDLIVFDSVKAKIHIITHAATDDPDALDKAEARLDQMQHAMQGEVPSFYKKSSEGAKHTRIGFRFQLWKIPLHA